MPNSHRPPDKPKRSCLCRVWCCLSELDCSERVRTSNFLSPTVSSCRESNSHHHRSGRDTDKTVLSRPALRCELALSNFPYTNQGTLSMLQMFRLARVEIEIAIPQEEVAMLGVVSTPHPHNCNALDCVSINRHISMQLLACQQGTARHGESGGDKCRGNDATFRQNSLTTTLFCRMINCEQLR